MATEQYFQEAMAQHEVGADESQSQKWKSGSGATTASDNITGCFDCNICLDHAKDPVVTLCGHLFCWPCIYKWLHLQGASTGTEQHQCCPVCKADVSLTTLVPLYGRGNSPTESESEGKGSQIGFDIPRRPPACGVHTLLTTTSTSSSPDQQSHRNLHQSLPHPHQHQQYYPQQYRNYATASTPLFHLSANVYHPIVGMLGEMVYARVFGNSETNFYAYPNSYYFRGGRSSPRLRRQEKQADKSLNRISIFLFCCLVLCLLLF
ncbi:hypothetical protein NE237_000705 [Protea cynaroides]|uniref:E3 ubiquitin-protein ligase RMA n=1 Tax=Protea cynaroides TaxID=273540 RepID=A0A9Q0QXR2_9MAGN|nr:hypothetical protein NE237_000705 [Protea cynaroides]